MEMNDPKTTAHPQPPSGGGTRAGLKEGGGIAGPPQSRLFTGNDKTREQQLHFIEKNVCVIVPVVWLSEAGGLFPFDLKVRRHNKVANKSPLSRVAISSKMS